MRPSPSAGPGALSPHPQPLEKLGWVNQASGLHVLFGLRERGMQGRAVGVVEPIARIQRQQLDFRAFREIRRFIDNQASVSHQGLDRHGSRVAPCAEPNNGPWRLIPVAERAR